MASVHDEDGYDDEDDGDGYDELDGEPMDVDDGELEALGIGLPDAFALGAEWAQFRCVLANVGDAFEVYVHRANLERCLRVCVRRSRRVKALDCGCDEPQPGCLVLMRVWPKMNGDTDWDDGPEPYGEAIEIGPWPSSS